jgi:hypothetical protein
MESFIRHGFTDKGKPVMLAAILSTLPLDNTAVE